MKTKWKRVKPVRYTATIDGNWFEIIRYTAEGLKDYPRWILYSMVLDYRFVPAFYDLKTAQQYAEKGCK